MSDIYHKICMKTMIACVGGVYLGMIKNKHEWTFLQLNSCNGNLWKRVFPLCLLVLEFSCQSQIYHKDNMILQVIRSLVTITFSNLSDVTEKAQIYILCILECLYATGYVWKRSFKNRYNKMLSIKIYLPHDKIQESLLGQFICVPYDSHSRVMFPSYMFMLFVY